MITFEDYKAFWESLTPAQAFDLQQVADEKLRQSTETTRMDRVTLADGSQWARVGHCTTDSLADRTGTWKRVDKESPEAAAETPTGNI